MPLNIINRIKTYSDVIIFPATKSAGALIIKSNEIADFESNTFGPLEISLRALDDSQITNNLVINLYVSYDGGTSWLLVGSYTDLNNGAGNSVAVINTALKFAPRVKIEADFDASGALTAGHGCGVDIRIEEIEPMIRRIIGVDVGNIGATLANSTVVMGTSISIPQILSPIKKVIIASYCEDSSQVTNNLTWKVQSSLDGTNWFDSTAAQTNIVNGSGSIFGELEVIEKLGKYVRVISTTDASGALASGHGVQFNITVLY